MVITHSHLTLKTIMNATKLDVSYVNSDVLGNEFVQYDPRQVKGYTGNLFIKPSKQWNLQSI